MSAQPLTAPVPVPRSVRFPSGWATIGDLAVGDLVFAADGTPTTITYLSAISDRDVVEVMFDDGQVVQCAPDRQWATSTAHTRSGPPATGGHDDLERVQWLRVLASTAATHGSPGETTQQLAVTAGISAVQAAQFARTAGIPYRLAAPARAPRPAASLPAGRGAALGTLVLAPVAQARTAVRLYAVDEFLTELADTLAVRGDLQPTQVRVTTTVMATTLDAQYAIACAGPTACDDVDLPVDPYLLGSWLSADPGRFQQLVPADRAERVMSPIRGMGLTETRAIPAIFGRASAPQRMALLRALVDADATVLGGTVQLPVTEPTLLTGVLELVRSLGIKARRAAPGAAIEFTTSLPVASDTHLAARLRPGAPASERRLAITAVRRTGTTGPARSLQVAHPAHLYLTGHFVPTHDGVPR